MEYAGLPRRKHSEDKATWPGRKQVYRQFDENGMMGGDTVALDHEQAPGLPLLEPVMAQGRMLAPAPTLDQSRTHLRRQLDQLPDRLKSLRSKATYPVRNSRNVCELAEQADRFIAQHATAAGT